MSGMSTQLHLMASKPGVYRGLSANMSGDGFSGMDFTARSTTMNDFNKWIQSAQSAKQLNQAAYNQLAAPSKNNQPSSYTYNDNGLYDRIIMKYMMPSVDGQLSTAGGL